MVEVLVVISIMVLLMVLLLPVLSSARVSGQLAQSLSNERQLTAAVLLYAEDSNSSVPFSLSGQFFDVNTGALISSVIPSWGWTLWSREYVASIKVFWSSARDIGQLDLNVMQSTGSTSYWYYIGYGANTEVMTTVAETVPQWQLTYNSNTYPQGIAPTRINDARTPPPDRLLLLCDAWNNSKSFVYGYSGVYRIRPENINTPDNAVNFLPFNYNGAVPHAYLDGHAIADSGDSMGWSVNEVPPIGVNLYTRSGPYGGNWTYSSPSQTKAAPWYSQYRK